MSATKVPAVTTRPVPSESDNYVSLAYKLGVDHALNGVPEATAMLAEHLRAFPARNGAG